MDDELYKDFKIIPINQNFNYVESVRGTTDNKFTPLWVLEINRKKENENINGDN
jgi:hypothetical protein